MAPLSTSTASGGSIVQTPADLLAQARRVDSTVNIEEYTLARIVASEGGREPIAIQRLLAGADLNRARSTGKTLLAHAAPNGRYGRQGVSGRPVSTSVDPLTSHLAIARELMGTSNPVRGAIAYFNPQVQYRCWSRPTECIAADATPGTKNKNQHPHWVHETWSFQRKRGTCGRDAQGRYQCPYGPRGAPAMEWIGQMEGVDPWRLLAYRRTPTSAHLANTELAQQLIERGIRGSSSVFTPTTPAPSVPFRGTSSGTPIVSMLVAAGALYMAAGGAV